MEFGDELVNLPTLVDEELFDPVGDLTKLEALLEVTPTMEITKSPKVEKVVEDEEHNSRLVVSIMNETKKQNHERRQGKEN
ncbi:hypothetical protein Hanom_Chr01g00048541 [Helianthus anomalus]